MSNVFVYKVRDQLGKVHMGEIEADSKSLVIERLRQSGYFITKVEPKSSSTTVGEAFAKWSSVSSKDLAILFRQFATMVAAGLPLLKCLNILADQTEKKKAKEAVEDIRREIESGSSLSQSMGKHTNIFPGFATAMIKAGEMGGVLDIVMERLAGHFENEHELKEKIKTAVRYPIIVISVAILVVIVLLTFVIPKFVNLFADLELKLPLPTKIVLGISSFFQSYFIFILVVIGISSILSIRYLRTTQGKERFDRYILKVPVFGNFVLKTGMAKVSRSLSTLLSSGVPIMQAIEITQDIADNVVIAEELGIASRGISEGSSMSGRLENSSVFTPMVVNMIAVGEETGNLENMLGKVADFYEREVKYMADNMASLIEPFLIVVLGVIVGGIMASIILPMFDVYSSLSGGM